MTDELERIKALPALWRERIDCTAHLTSSRDWRNGIDAAREQCAQELERALGPVCGYCGEPSPCDSDCVELAAIYREQQREKLRDLDLDQNAEPEMEATPDGMFYVLDWLA